MGYSVRGVSSGFLSLALLLLVAKARSLNNETETDSRGIQRRSLAPSSASSMNYIDGCWRSDPMWAHQRMRLAVCAKGFGSSAKGGNGGKYYTVTRDDDDPVNPKPRSLRYAVTRPGKLWIVFAHNMIINLKMPLLVTSHKTIDGRGANVHIAHGHCIFLFNVTNVIIHGLHIHHCLSSSFGYVTWYDSLSESMGPTDGDAISIVASRNIWIDHNDLSATADGLVDITLGSNHVTVSNNHFHDHDKVMLLGHDDSYTADKHMCVTIAFNRFGANCGQRMPRVRYGYAHVANNAYDQGWGIYAIGGSASPTIRSEGNRFIANDNPWTKEATFQWIGPSRVISVRDTFINGAYFTETVKHKDTANPHYSLSQRFPVLPSSSIAQLTSDAGPLNCLRNRPCY